MKMKLLITKAAQRQKLMDSNEYTISFFIRLVCVGWGEIMQRRVDMKTIRLNEEEIDILKGALSDALIIGNVHENREETAKILLKALSKLQ
ncbi:hypothetical protein EVU96_09040 [Bacillus infantis]|uniref:hypothetical protein n=1 Tax=Bacillus infantis TaxID=324767 RepID=UPI0010CF8164|nr:hypothetical protein [Bacillus infantis]RYI30550.1 hypothetical protein EVU96_09040 [Bacillus infantis]